VTACRDQTTLTPSGSPSFWRAFYRMKDCLASASIPHLRQNIVYLHYNIQEKGCQSLTDFFLLSTFPIRSPAQPTPCLSKNSRRATLSGWAWGWSSAKATSAPGTWARRAAKGTATSVGCVMAGVMAAAESPLPQMS